VWWRLTWEKLDVAEADFEKADMTDFRKAGCGRGSELDSESCGLL